MGRRTVMASRMCRQARAAEPANGRALVQRTLSYELCACRLLAMQQAAGPAGAGPAVGHAHGIEAAAVAAGLLRCICGSMAGRGMMVQCEVRLRWGGS